MVQNCYQINTPGNILYVIGRHPVIVPEALFCSPDNVPNLLLGMKYVAADKSFYSLDAQGDIIPASKVDVSQYL